MLPRVDLTGDMRVPRVAVERLVANAMKSAKESDLAIDSETMQESDLSGLCDEELERIISEAVRVRLRGRCRASRRRSGRAA
jgi:hypothetical protein